MINKLYALILLSLLVIQSVWAANTIDVSLEKKNLVLTPIHGGDGSAWGLENCSACHFKSRIHQDAPAIRDIVNEVGFSSCTGCHGSNGSKAERNCTICHNDQRLPHAPLQKGMEGHDFSADTTLEMMDKDCATCHYNSDMNGKFEIDVDLTRLQDLKTGLNLPYKSKTEFCLRCHNRKHQQPGYEIQARFDRDPLVIVSESYHTMDFHGYPKGLGTRSYTGLREGQYQYGDLVECTDCHAMHGTHNPKLIVDRSDWGMTRLAPSIRNIPINIHIEQGDYSQLCVTCHAMNTLVEQGNEDTGNGLSGVHQVGTDCTRCHVHGAAAQTGL